MGRVQTPSEALKYPLTTVSLNLAEPDQTYSKQSKINFCRFFYEKSHSIADETSV